MSPDTRSLILREAEFLIRTGARISEAVQRSRSNSATSMESASW